jgi:hypothetical protein
MQKPTVTQIRPTDFQRELHLRQVRLVRESLLRGRAGDEKR